MGHAQLNKSEAAWYGLPQANQNKRLARQACLNDGSVSPRPQSGARTGGSCMLQCHAVGPTLLTEVDVHVFSKLIKPSTLPSPLAELSGLSP